MQFTYEVEANLTSVEGSTGGLLVVQKELVTPIRNVREFKKVVSPEQRMGAGILVIFTETLTGDALESMVERYKSYFSAIVTFGKDCFSPQDAMVSHLAIESREISKERGGGFIAVSCVPPKDRGL